MYNVTYPAYQHRTNDKSDSPYQIKNNINYITEKKWYTKKKFNCKTNKCTSMYLTIQLFVYCYVFR
jgi:hypothetical protein